ncbi:MAG: hypothetical protein KDI77_14560, partial [Gammaproteobacteria bacterium]|nr:hypothetical protein [Gammaproteobacteria bacterium]
MSTTDQSIGAGLRLTATLLIWGVMVTAWTTSVAAGGVRGVIDSIADSEMVFKRSTSNVPFLPVAFLNTSYYGDTEVRDPSAGGRTFSYNQ